MARFDLSDEQWQVLMPLLPAQHSGRRGHPYKDHRTVLNGILWIVRTGSPWRDMPELYGSWKSCYHRLRRWERRGIWTRVMQCLMAHPSAGEDGQSIEPVEWYVCAIDSTTIKAHPHAAGAPRKRGVTRRPRKTNRTQSPSRPLRTTIKPSDAAEGA